MTCPIPEPANLPDWLKTVLQGALPELRTLRYDLEVYQPKNVFEKHAERISKLIATLKATLTDQTTAQDKNEPYAEKGLKVSRGKMETPVDECLMMIEDCGDRGDRGDRGSKPTELFKTLPWNVGFSDEIGDRLSPNGNIHPDMGRHTVIQVWDYDGNHVCWAKSSDHAVLIVNAVNHLHRNKLYRQALPG